MNKLTLPAMFLLIANLTTASAAEITTCVTDTSIKNNPTFYYFPITVTRLRCDHVRSNTSVTLSDLYQDNWRLIQVIKPILIEQKDKKSAYTPPVLYLERTIVPARVKQKDTATESSYSSDDSDGETTTDDTSKSESGGLFNWLKGDTQEGTESE